MKIDLKTLNYDFLDEVSTEIFNRCIDILEEEIHDLLSTFETETISSEWSFESKISNLKEKIEEFLSEESCEESFKIFTQDYYIDILDFTNDEIKSQNFFDLVVDKLFKKYSYEKITKEKAKNKFNELLKEVMYI